MLRSDSGFCRLSVGYLLKLVALGVASSAWVAGHPGTGDGAEQTVVSLSSSPSIPTSPGVETKCPKCSVHLSSSQEAQAHRARQRYRCAKCSDSFCSTELLIIHRTSRAHQCLKCFASFCSAESLQIHESLQTHQCPRCSAYFCSAEFLRAHEAKMLHPCSACAACFCSAEELQNHRSRQTHQCLECAASFCSAEFLQAHAGNKAYECSNCSARFCSTESLKDHQAAHALERLSCATSKEQFAPKADLNAHQKTHFPSPTCSYPDCGRVFSAIKYRNAHERSSHAEASLRTCPDCGKVLGSIDALKVHRRRHPNPGRAPHPKSLPDAGAPPSSSLGSPVVIESKLEGSAGPSPSGSRKRARGSTSPDGTGMEAPVSPLSVLRETEPEDDGSIASTPELELAYLEDIMHSSMFLGSEAGFILGDLFEVDVPIVCHEGDAGKGPQKVKMVSRVRRATTAFDPGTPVIRYHLGHYSVLRPAAPGETPDFIGESGQTYLETGVAGTDGGLRKVPADGHCLITAISFLRHGVFPDARQIADARQRIAGRLESMPDQLSLLVQEGIASIIAEGADLIVDERGEERFPSWGPRFSSCLNRIPRFMAAHGAKRIKIQHEQIAMMKQIEGAQAEGIAPSAN